MSRSLLVRNFVAALSLVPAAQACTGIRLVARDGGVVAARALEFGFDLHSDVLAFRRNRSTGTLSGRRQGHQLHDEIRFLGANAEGMTAIVDGINDSRALCRPVLFPGLCSYPDATKDNVAHAMAPHEYANLAPRQFRQCRRGQGQFRQGHAGAGRCRCHQAGRAVHFVVHDRSGKSVVIEPVEQDAEDLRQSARRRDEFADLRLAHDQPAQLRQSHRR